MHHLARFILIAAPCEAVFAFVADYRNIPRFQPQFTEVRLLTPTAQGVGAEIAMRGTFRGLPITAHSRIVAYEPPTLFVTDSSGQVQSCATWRFTPRPDASTHTRAALDLDYEVHLPGLGWLLGNVVQRDVEALTIASLRRVKRLLETPPP